MQQRKIAVIVGSLRKDSFNRKMAKVLIGLAPQELKLELVEIASLSLYNQDLEDSPPTSWTEFRNQLSSYEGVLFVTPEYNRSVPGVLKNAIDIGSRPTGKNIWDAKASAIVTLSPGAMGGFGSNHHLRQVMVGVGSPTMVQPEAYIGGAAKLFNEKSELVNDSTKEFMQKFLFSFAKWVERNSKLL